MCVCMCACVRVCVCVCVCVCACVCACVCEEIGRAITTNHVITSLINFFVFNVRCVPE